MEWMRFDDFETGKKSLQIGDDQLLQPDEAWGPCRRLSDGGQPALIGKCVGDLDAGEALLTVRVLHHDGKIQARLEICGKGRPGSKARGASTRKTVRWKYSFRRRAICFAEVAVIDQHNAGAAEFGANIFAQAAIGYIGQANDLRRGWLLEARLPDMPPVVSRLRFPKPPFASGRRHAP